MRCPVRAVGEEIILLAGVLREIEQVLLEHSTVLTRNVLDVTLADGAPGSVPAPLARPSASRTRRSISAWPIA